MADEIKKVCPACGEAKLKSEFEKSTVLKDGLRTLCKPCRYLQNRKWVAANQDKAKNTIKQWKKNHPDNLKTYIKKGLSNGKTCIARRKWVLNNIDKVRAYRRAAHKRNVATVRGKLTHNIKSAIFHSLKNQSKAGHHWETLIGYTVDNLKRHLEKQFEPGMSWDNYGRGGWHIDHKIPISAFNFDCPKDIDFKRCWALKNLQPLWAKQNLSKYNKLEKPFQMALLITSVYPQEHIQNNRKSGIHMPNANAKATEQRASKLNVPRDQQAGSV